MDKVLVACRAGVGSSLMLKIEVAEVVKEHNLPLTIEHASIDAISGFDGNLVITVVDVAEELELKGLKQEVIGIVNIVDKVEILTKLTAFLNNN